MWIICIFCFSSPDIPARIYRFLEFDFNTKLNSYIYTEVFKFEEIKKVPFIMIIMKYYAFINGYLYYLYTQLISNDQNVLNKTFKEMVFSECP